MDHSMLNTATPPNINTPYAGALAGVLSGFIVLLAARHFIFGVNRRGYRSRWWARYHQIERYTVNKCAYTPKIRQHPILPPIGAILLCIAFATTALPLLLVQVDLSVNSNRAGFLAISLVPFILASVGKNSAVALLTGISPVKLNFLHRTLATGVVILATVHMAPMLQTWSKFPSFLQSQLATAKVQYGLGAYGCLCVVFLGSLPPVRKFCYEAFLVSHLFAFGFIGAIAKHTPYAMRYFFAGLVCYVVNVIVGWFVQSRAARARVEALPNQCTRISFRLSSPIYHQPGQSIYVNLPTISYFEWHPFTITNVRSIEGDMIEIHACVRGNFTRKLYTKADNVADREWIAFLSGPCGGDTTYLAPTHILSSQASVALLNAGAGVTFGMRLLRELGTTLLEDLSEKQTHFCTQDIYFCWSVRRAGELEWFKQELQQWLGAFKDASRAMNLTRIPRLHVYYYITEEADETFSETIDISPQAKPTTNEAANILGSPETTLVDAQPVFVFGQRMDPRSLLTSFGGNSLGVYACGPSGFNASVKNSVASLSSLTQAPFLHCEQFEF